MARYEIKRWRGMDCVSTSTRVRRAIAVDTAYRMAYETLRGHGKLDTKAAWVVKHVIDAWDDLWQPGESRTCVISNTGYSVTMTRKH